MKKILLLILTSIIFISSVNAEEQKEEVKLINCDSAVSLTVETTTGYKRIRLLMMDSSNGSLDKEISNYVCNKVKNASKLEIEIDPLSDKENKYKETLVYLYVDGYLLQNDLISLGYAQVNYVYNDYKYVDELCDLQKNALENKLGIWNYPDIKEEYCQSGVVIKNETKDEEKNEEKKTKDNKNIKKILFINFILVIFLIIFLKRKHTYEN